MLSRFVLVLLLLSGGMVRADGLRAGAAKVDITPPTGYAMWGYSSRRDQPSLGVSDRLYARALVLEVGKERLALVSLDLGRAPTRNSTAVIRIQVKRTAGVGTLFLVASHTHHGPVLEVDTWPTPKRSYARQLEQKVCEAIMAAVRALEPAKLGVGSRQTKLNHNRHSKRADAPVDRELLVLRVETNKGKLIAHAINFAAHPTMQPREVRKFSADYPGFMASLVEKETHALCLFLQGAAGDLSPHAPAGHEGAEKFGQVLGREVLALSKTIRPQALEKTTLKTREEDFSFACRVDLRVCLEMFPLKNRASPAAEWPLFGFFHNKGV